MAKKACVKLYLVQDNWIELYQYTYTEKQKFRIGIALNKLPVVKYDKKRECNIISLYYYDRAVEVLEEANIMVYIEERIPKAYKRLHRKITKTDYKIPSEQPIAWVSDKDKVILPYQQIGTQSVLNRFKYIVADQMGLGKTIEALATICYAFEYGYKRALIVVMASLKEQWKEEILRFTTYTEDDIIILGDNKKVKCRTGEAEKYHGSKKVCKECNHFLNCQLMKQSPDKVRRHQLLKQKDVPIVITNYEMVYKYADQIINGGFDIYVVDEASKIKNHTSQQTRGMMKIARRFEYDDIFMPMSGTLIENRIQEFYPVFSMIDPAIFGSWTNFKNRYLVLDFWGKPVDVQNTNELKNIVKKFMIRRTSDEVWEDRPELFEMYRYCEMSDIHEKIYNDILEGKAEDLRDEVDKKINKMDVASLLVYLTMVAGTVESVKDLGKHTADEFSCKIKMLKDIMQNEIDGKVVLFSRYAKRVVPYIKREMDKEGVDNLLITGSTKSSKRLGIVKKFKKKDKYRLLICSDSMTYGANIQCAKYLINFDLPWNPAIIDQRIARLYRKGQKKNVTVINLVTKNSAEELVLDKIYSKREMFDEFIGSGVKPKAILNNITVADILKQVKNVG